MSSIQFESVTVKINKQKIIDDVSFEVVPSSWTCLIGPNGAGKTTLLKATLGLLQYEGRIYPYAELAPKQRAKLIAYVPQQPVFPEVMTVYQYMMLGRTPHVGFFASETKQDHQIVKETLEQLQLSQLAQRYLSELSGGERQRAVIGRALVQQASVLLLDELANSLDIGHQQEVLELIDELRHQRGLTVLSTMHDLTIAGQYADQLVMLNQGKCVAKGTAQQVLSAENIQQHYGAQVKVEITDNGVTIIPLRGTVNTIQNH